MSSGHEKFNAYLAKHASSNVPEAEREPKSEARPEPEDDRMTLMEAFELGDNLDDEKAIRAVALLLDWSSEDGNEPLDGFVAQGLMRVLYRVADGVSPEVGHRWQERRKRLKVPS